ncbi:MAG: C10 family peptidase [Paludibacteraceae bacterium]|nr:C10 family peptidase [Paludibacteraceae bacterium]
MRKFFTGILLLVISMTVLADQITVEEAASIAASFTSGIQQKSGSRVKKAARKTTAADVDLIYQVAKPNSDEPALYVFNKPEGGWVIVSADDNTVSILGYSDEGSFDGTKENVAFMMDYYAERIANARPLSEEQKSQRKASAPRRAKAETVTPVSPLLDIDSIKWNQDSPYQDMCPIDKYNGSLCPTGCTATAAAQIMRFWKWPNQGMGTFSYTWEDVIDRDDNKKALATFDTVLSVDYGATIYNWDLLLPRYIKDESKGNNYTEEQGREIAKLMYHTGVAAKMHYGGDASGAYIDDMGNGMMRNFRYKSKAYYYQEKESKLPFDSIAKLFSIDLHAGRPILMAGDSRKGGGGHSFVCDGMTETDGQVLFHINWGWDGSSNGYYVLNTLEPGEEGIGGNEASGGYGKHVNFMFGLEPDKDPTHVTGISLNKSTLTMYVNERAKLVTTITPSDASNKFCEWTSSNSNVATVDASGNVRGVAPGTATITASTFDGGLTATCEVTISAEPMPTIEIPINQRKTVEWEGDGKKNKWKITISYNGDYPWLQFYIPGDVNNPHIAGTYDLADEGLYAWPSAEDHKLAFYALSGWLNLTCVGYHNGSNGSNTYKIESEFIGENGRKYHVSYTKELYYKDADGNKLAFEDQVGDGTPTIVKWYALGQEFATNLASKGTVVLPEGQPASCGNGRVFVGWSANEINPTNARPELVQNGDSVNNNATYYAVYANRTAGTGTVGEIASVKFNHYSGDDDLNVANMIDSMMAYDRKGLKAINGVNVFPGKNGIRLGVEDKQIGWLTLTLNEPIAVKKVIVDAAQFANDKKCYIRVLAGSQLVGNVKQPAANLEFSASEPILTNTIKIAINKQHTYIDAITILAEDMGTYSNYSTSCSGTATDNPTVYVDPINKEGIILTRNSINLDLTESHRLVYTIAPYNTHDQNVTWVSNNPDVASVSADGTVTGLSAGTATITVTADNGEYSATCEVNVSDHYHLNVLDFVRVFDHSYNTSESRISIGLQGEEASYYPYIWLMFKGDITNWKIAGHYELDGQNYITGWPTAAQYNLSGHPAVKSVSGWLNITCVKKGKYRLQAQYRGNNGLDYAIDYTTSISDIKVGNDRHTLTDNAGEGETPDSVFFVSMGDTIATTYISGGTLVLPTVVPTNCSNKTFVGWITESNYDSDIAPTFAQAGDATSANSTYYAVFANPNGATEDTEVASIIFNDMEDTSSWYDDGSIGSKSVWDLVNSHYNIADVHGYYFRPGAHGVRIGSSSQDEYNYSHKGYLQLTLSDSTHISKMVITSSKTRDNDKGVLYIDLGDVHDDTPINCGENVAYIPTDSINANLIQIATKEKAAYIKSVAIYSKKPAYNGYTTTCQEPEVPHAITTIAENGTITTGGITSAIAGETVTITATPDHCYELETLSVKDTDNNVITVTDNTFIMPDKAVTVTATFKVSRYTVTTESDNNGNASIE